MTFAFRVPVAIVGFVALGLFASQPAQAKDKLEIVSVQASPRYYDASCPARFRIVARIRVSRATTVQYRFVGPGRGKVRFRTLRFRREGTKTIKTSWRVASSKPTFRQRVRLELQARRLKRRRSIVLRGRCANITSEQAVGLRCPADVIRVRRDVVGSVADPWTNARPRPYTIHLSRLRVRGQTLYCSYMKGGISHTLKRPFPDGLTRCSVIDNRYFRCE